MDALSKIGSVLRAFEHFCIGAIADLAIPRGTYIFMDYSKSVIASGFELCIVVDEMIVRNNLEAVCEYRNTRTQKMSNIFTRFRHTCKCDICIPNAKLANKKLYL